MVDMSRVDINKALMEKWTKEALEEWRKAIDEAHDAYKKTTTIDRDSALHSTYKSAKISSPGARDRDETTKRILRELEQRKKKGTKMSRRPKGSLERQLLLVCNDFVTGVIDTENPCLTPSHAALLVGEREVAATSAVGGTLEYAPPSAGAITNIMQKWGKYGYAQTLDRPFGFLNYTENAYRPEITTPDDLVREVKAREKAANLHLTTVEATVEEDVYPSPTFLR